MLRIDIAFVKNGSPFFTIANKNPLMNMTLIAKTFHPCVVTFLISFAICSGLAAFSSAKRKGAGEYHTHNAARDPSTYFLP
jgi:hypothetical protein